MFCDNLSDVAGGNISSKALGQNTMDPWGLKVIATPRIKGRHANLHRKCIPSRYNNNNNNNNNNYNNNYNNCSTAIGFSANPLENLCLVKFHLEM